MKKIINKEHNKKIINITHQHHNKKTYEGFRFKVEEGASMRKEGDLWDDSSLINAFDQAISTFNILFITLFFTLQIRSESENFVVN